MMGRMKRRAAHPTAQEIQALVDGELGEARAAAVRQHCESCSDCRQIREGCVAVCDLLAADLPPELLRPMWPQIRNELHRVSARRFDLFFAAGTSALAAAGLVLGILLGSLGAPARDRQQQDIWSAIGSSLTGEARGALSGTYVPSGDSGDPGASR